VPRPSVHQAGAADPPSSVPTRSLLLSDIVLNPTSLPEPSRVAGVALVVGAWRTTLAYLITGYAMSARFRPQRFTADTACVGYERGHEARCNQVISPLPAPTPLLAGLAIPVRTGNRPRDQSRERRLAALGYRAGKNRTHPPGRCSGHATGLPPASSDPGCHRPAVAPAARCVVGAGGGPGKRPRRYTGAQPHAEDGSRPYSRAGFGGYGGGWWLQGRGHNGAMG
jgi:hypothetical protein